uniref:AbiH family protein n=1 Tax=Bacteroides caecimuris TaxID=1796613 RepID=UPI00272995DB
MNRIIIIGNGFDKAHGLATGYRDFIDSYWINVACHIFNGYKRSLAEHFGAIIDPSPYEDKFVLFEVFRDKRNKMLGPSSPQSDSTPYDEVRELVAIFNDSTNMRYDGSVRLTFKNKFFEHISGRCSLSNWVDIENEYYEKLKELLAEEDAVIRSEKVRALNREFDAVKKQLEIYLIEVVQKTQTKLFPSIQEVFNSIIDLKEVAFGGQKIFFDSIYSNIFTLGEDDAVELDKNEDPNYLFYHSQDAKRKYYVLKHLSDKHFKERNCTPANTLILNFNYTQTAKQLYTRDADEIIDIHGALNNERNPIIFGYGDELDDDYKRIEKLQDNDFLENIKSVHYHETGNYRQLLGFIESEPYQVITMGHSCGNSDRTLLNTLFEHRNCISVKVYYHQREDGTDDYSQLIRNLSRNFNDKAAMRDKVVNKEYCLPLVPIAGQE